MSSDSDEDFADLPPLMRNTPSTIITDDTGTGAISSPSSASPSLPNTGAHKERERHQDGIANERSSEERASPDSSDNGAITRRIIKAKRPPGMRMQTRAQSIKERAERIKERADANNSNNADQSANSDSEHASSSEHDGDGDGDSDQDASSQDGNGQPNPRTTFRNFIAGLQDPTISLDAIVDDHSEDEDYNDDDFYSDDDDDNDDDEEDDYEEEEEDSIRSDGHEKCYCPGCVSGRQMLGFGLGGDDDDDDCSTSDGDMPSLEKRYHTDSSDDVLSSDNNEKKEDDASVDSNASLCAICFSEPSYHLPFITLPCCGYSREKTTDGEHAINVESTSTTRFCQPCIIKTLQSQDTTFPFNHDCVGECPRCRQVIAVNSLEYSARDSRNHIELASFNQIIRHARYKGKEMKDALVTIAFANPSFLPNELFPDDQDCMRQFCSWGIVDKKEGRAHIYTIDRGNQESLKAYVINFLVSDDGLPGMILASGDMFLAGLYAVMKFKVLTALRLANQASIVLLMYFVRMPVLEDVWQEVLMGGLNCFLLAMLLQVVLFVLIYGAICFISVRLMKVLMQMSLDLKEKWNDDERPSLVDVYFMFWKKEIKCSDLLTAFNKISLVGISIAWFVLVMLISKAVLVRTLFSRFIGKAELIEA